MLASFDVISPHAIQAPMDPNLAAFSGAFGGWTAAHALAAALTHGDGAQPVLSMTIDFTKGIREGDVQSSASVLAATRSTKFIRVDTTQAGHLCASSSVVLAQRRDTQAVSAVPMPTCAAPESLAPLALPDGPVTWFQQLDIRFAQGQPLKPSERMRSLAWTKLKKPNAMSECLLVALADASFPRIYFHFPKPSPIATVSMTVHFHASPSDLQAVGDDFVLIDAHSNIANHGFFDQAASLWARSGTLLATTTQVVRYDV
jgi:acyl-CoA thioesterase